jgi:electron transfer flavoprotein alpha/beta subunit
MAAAPVVVLLRRLQARPGAPSANDEGEVLGRCEGGALAAAIQIGGRLDVPVIAIAVGPARREERVLAMALRAGCTRAVRIDDSELGDVDYLGLAQVLAAAVKHVGARAVLCGDRSQDEGAGAIGPAVAELLDWSHLTGVVRQIVEGNELVVVRQADTAHQRFRVPLPVVLCVTAPAVQGPAIPEPVDTKEDEEDPPEPVKRPRKRARTPVTNIEELDLADLGIDARAVAPRRTSAGKLRAVRGRGAPSLSTSVVELVAQLRADHLLGGGSGS